MTSVSPTTSGRFSKSGRKSVTKKSWLLSKIRNGRNGRTRTAITSSRTFSTTIFRELHDFAWKKPSKSGTKNLSDFSSKFFWFGWARMFRIYSQVFIPMKRIHQLDLYPIHRSPRVGHEIFEQNSRLFQYRQRVLFVRRIGGKQTHPGSFVGSQSLHRWSMGNSARVFALFRVLARNATGRCRLV